ncbi:MAG: sensor histidine kinase [Armatimonadota bacterium]
MQHQLHLSDEAADNESKRLRTIPRSAFTGPMVHKRPEVKLIPSHAELEQHICELTAVNAELEAFTYSVSHDLRAPLWNITSFAETLIGEEGEQLSKQARELVAYIHQSSIHMAELIDGLLSLSRLTRDALVIQDVHLSSLAHEIADGLHQAQPGRNVEFVIAPDIVVLGDARLLRIALDNLLGNAWKFTMKRKHARIEFGMRMRKQQKIYFVNDNGAGFNQAYAEKLFTPFQRLHRATDYPGTGIGLATVQRIISRHNGRVWARGVLDQGATVFFSLDAGGSRLRIDSIG